MQNIVFDWTGVIKDAVHEHLRVVNRMFEELEVPPLSLDELKETWKQPYMDFYKTHLPDLTMERQKEVYFKAFSEVSGAKAYEGMVKLLKKLKSQNYKMVLLSSDSPKSLCVEMKNFDLENIFDDMELEVHDKVDHIKDLVSRNKMDAEKTAIIGDTNNEIEAGKSVNIKTIAVTWGLCSEKNLKQYGPDHIVHTVQNLEEILNIQKN